MSFISIKYTCHFIRVVSIAFAIILASCMPEAPEAKNGSKSNAPGAADSLSETKISVPEDSVDEASAALPEQADPDLNDAEVLDSIEEEATTNMLEDSPIFDVDTTGVPTVENDDNTSLAALMLRYAPLMEIASANRFFPQPQVSPESDLLHDLVHEAVADFYESLSDEQNAEVLILQEEVSALREELRQLGESLDIYLGAIMADLRDENHVLRQEMRRLYAREEDGAPIILPDVPRPHGEMIDGILYQEEIEYTAALEAQAAIEAAPPPFRFDVLEEWGRSPEDALNVGNDVASLKGIIGVIPAGSIRKDIEELAFQLRTQYEVYDNINIEIFDDPVAARQFSDRGATDPTRRIISISKYKNSGRDIILYFENGEPKELSQQS